MARIVYIPKTAEPSVDDIDDFRELAIGNVEGKLFFSMVSQRLTRHIVGNNKFVNASIQKGCMEKVPGCWEHMSMVWKALKDARERGKDLVNIWLDIANAYGSIPHQLIFFALKRYGVPARWISVVRNYYQGLWSRSFSETAPSSWHQHERGIFAGCTLSIILFISGMNVIIEYVTASGIVGYTDGGNVTLPPIRAFMDDVDLMTTTVINAQPLLKRCCVALVWARMKYRVKKSRSIVIKKGRSLNTTPFSIGTGDSLVINPELVIPSIHSNHVKFLGRIVNGALSDRRSVDELSDKLEEGLRAINKSQLRGASKLWILSNLLLQRIRWPLMIYEVSISVAMVLEKKVSVFIRRWLRLSPKITSLALYSKITPCPLPLVRLTSLLTESKISGYLQLRDSKDKLVSSAVPVLKAGTWDSSKAVRNSESVLMFQDMFGAPNKGKMGLGCSKNPPLARKGTKLHREQVRDVSRDLQGELDLAKAVTLSVQGQWTRWQNYIKNDFSWNKLLGMPSNLLSFSLNATFDTLPTPSNLFRWRITTEKSCLLCPSDVCTTAHILGSCRGALDQGRITWRHDSVLFELFNEIIKFLGKYKPLSGGKRKQKFISFVSPGTLTHPKKHKRPGLFHLASDWVVLVDFDGNLVFPAHIASRLISERPDLVIYSDREKYVILIELTCPCEENIEAWHAKKLATYNEKIVPYIKENGWSVSLFAIEVGARGYCATSVKYCLNTLGFSGKDSRRIIGNLGMISMKRSFHIWLARNSPDWVLDSPSCPWQKVKHRFETKTVSSGRKHHNTPHERQHISSPQSKSSRSPPTPTPNQVDSETITSSKGTTSRKPLGLANKGNTCYANSLLQAFLVVPACWSSFDPSSTSLTPLIRDFARTLVRLKQKYSQVDIAPFLTSLQRSFVASGNRSFQWNQQQDVREVFYQLNLEVERSTNSDSWTAISSSFQERIKCSYCSYQSVNYSETPGIQVAVQNNILESINKFLEPESLNGENSWFCPACQTKREATKHLCFTSVPDVLMIQINRWLQDPLRPTVFIKDDTIVRVSDDVVVSMYVDEEVTFDRNLKLMALICHSGTLNRGHYFTYAKHGSEWFRINDKAVHQIPNSLIGHSLNNRHSYVALYSS